MNVLVTGGTGHLGGELLVVLSRLPDVERVFCLVRPKHGKSGRARLASVFELHGDELDPKKMQAIEGDLADAELASSLARQMAPSRVEVIVHCAANTSFSPFQSAAVDGTNVEGLARFLRWAAGLPELRTFLYVGTAAICGRDVRERVVREEEPPNPAARHLVRYTRSKLQAELLVRERLRPEQVLIARPSIVLGDRRGLRPRSVDVLWAVAAIHRLRLLPINPRLSLDIVPIDYAAQALAALLLAERRHDVYHVSAGTRGATSAHALSVVLSTGLGDQPPFRFDERLSIDDVRRWLRGTSAAPAEHADYLRHWARITPSRSKLYALFCALAPYLEFMQLGQVFDNSRLLGDTRLESPKPAELYLPLSLEYVERLDLQQGAEEL